MVIMVTSMTEQQSHDDEKRFKSNLQRELRTMERRKAYASSMKIGQGAVLYFGPYFGGLIFLAGMVEFLRVIGVIHLTEMLLISILIMVLGSLIIIASLFASRVVMRIEVEQRE